MTTTQAKEAPVASAAQESDNVAHALAGAGGGILSTALTYDLHMLIEYHN